MSFYIHQTLQRHKIFNQTIRNEVEMLTVNETEEQITKNIVTHKPVLDFIQFSPNPLSIVWQCDHHDHFFYSYLPINCISFILIIMLPTCLLGLFQ